MAIKPIIVATWKFGASACQSGWKILSSGGSALDAVESGANVVELDPDVNSVGFGGLPNAEGVVELDAAIMDGKSHSAGAVAGMSGISSPISVARRVMETTLHVMLVGGNARRFAMNNGFSFVDLLTDESREKWERWQLTQLTGEMAHFDQLNHELPDTGAADKIKSEISHDTVGVCALDSLGDLAAACTTSGMAWKVPGRVGDSPIIGSGLYVDNDLGAVTATGNGDEMMKVCLSYRVMFYLEQGYSPQAACEEGIKYLLRKRPGHQSLGASCLAISKSGDVGSAATKDGFHFPDRLWEYSVCKDGVTSVVEGAYV